MDDPDDIPVNGVFRAILWSLLVYAAVLVATILTFWLL